MLLIRAVAAAAVAAALSVHVLPAAAQAPAAWTPELMLTVKRVPAVVSRRRTARRSRSSSARR